MGQNSAIEWTDHTFNPWWGCVKVAAGCKNCYAETLATRFGFDVWGPNSNRRIFDERHWNELRKWNTQARKAGTPARVFCGSMCDIFEVHEDPELNELVLNRERASLWDLIEETPHLIWMLLTKRPQNIEKLIPVDWWAGLPRNVWLGYSASTQQDLDSGWPVLAGLENYMRPTMLFLSLEPLLGPIDIEQCLVVEGTVSWGPGEDDWGYDVFPRDDGLWVIAGGESGPKARPMHPDWVRAIRDQCVNAEVPFFFKQWGEWLPFGQKHAEWNYPASNYFQAIMDRKVIQQRMPGIDVFKVGKKAAGRLLDGVEWNQLPE